MSFMKFIQTNIFATILTLLVTVATCVISRFQEYKKIKIENFDKIYDCLANFTEKRAETIDKCNEMMKRMADALPEKGERVSDEKWKKQYKKTYDDLNRVLTEYSKHLELFMPFSGFLYKSRPVMRIVTAECWSVLKLYEQLVELDDTKEYRIHYGQIVTLVQFIRMNGSHREKKRLHRYLKSNSVET